MYYPVVVSRVSPRRRTFYQCVAVLLFIVGIGYALRTFVPAKKVNGSWVLQIGTQRYRLHIGPQEAPMATLAPVAAPTIHVITPANAREKFALDLLSQLGNTTPTNATVSMVVQWTLMEDRGTDASSRNNYLNTTICGHNFVGAINKDGACGVGHYATYADGINATVDTLHQSNFSSIAEALVANDPEQAKQRLWASGWAESHYNDGVGWDSYQVAAPSNVQATSSVLTASGDFGAVVQLALNANNGKIKDFTLKPGETWSFGKSIAPISAMGNLPIVGGVPAGGWCDTAALYIEVADQLGLASVVPAHVGNHPPRFPGVWLNEDGTGANADGSGDVTITNTTDHTIAFHMTIQGDTYQVSAGPVILAPSIDPLGTAHVVMTQGYGVGSHAPAAIWGAIDLAIDGDGDGQADGPGTQGAPIYATMDGTVYTAVNTWPAGNHVWLENEHYRVGYSHLNDFVVADGQSVKRGDLIGHVGATGEASGPHLDYQVWKDGSNVNPLDYGGR